VTQPVVRRHAWLTGAVQGVFFRDTCRQLAQRRHVAGWVRNLPDGRVEAVFEGAAPDVERLVDWCRQGPPRAMVDSVEVREEPPEQLTSFRVVSHV
jgi:acylphosphatase